MGMARYRVCRDLYKCREFLSESQRQGIQTIILGMDQITGMKREDSASLQEVLWNDDPLALFPYREPLEICAMTTKKRKDPPSSDQEKRQKRTINNREFCDWVVSQMKNSVALPYPASLDQELQRVCQKFAMPQQQNGILKRIEKLSTSIEGREYLGQLLNYLLKPPDHQHYTSILPRRSLLVSYWGMVLWEC